MPPTTPTTFPLFPLLPPELRLKIYTLSLLSTPRLIILSSQTTPIYSTPAGDSTFDFYFPPTTRPPPLLRTTSESRALALSLYTRAFPYHDPFLNQEIYTYINFTIDVIALYESNIDIFPRQPPEMARIRNVIIRVHDEKFHSFEDGNSFTGPFALLEMRGVREVTVVRFMDLEWEKLEQGWGVYEKLLRGEFEREFGGWEGGLVRFLEEDGLKGQGEDLGVVEGEYTRSVWREFVEGLDRW